MNKLYDVFNRKRNDGNSSSGYRGTDPVSFDDYRERYMTDNMIVNIGYILEVYAGGYVAQVRTNSTTEMAIWCGMMNGGISETKDISVLSAGTACLLIKMRGGPNIIIGTLPGMFFDQGINYSVLDTEYDYTNIATHSELTDNIGDRDLLFFNNDKPLDTLPGEVGWINENGNVIGLMRGLALLKGTELSQVQVHQIDDLVRVISGCYEHLSGPMEEYIYDFQGNMNIEKMFYTTREECYGTNEPILDEEQNNTLKELDRYPRIISFVGQLSDTKRTYFIGQKKQEGKQDINLTDCTIESINGYSGKNIRTTNEIRFSQTPYIYVPYRTKKYHEQKEVPQIEEVEEFIYPEENRTVAEKEAEAYNCEVYENRNYNKENWNNKKTGPENSETFSLMTQRKDGSILIQDKAGSYIELKGDGNIEIGCKKNILFRNGENFSLICGQNISMRSKENMEFSASNGSIKAKAEQDISLISINDGILIDANSNKISGIHLRSNENITLENTYSLLNMNKKNMLMNCENEFRIEGNKVSIKTENNFVSMDNKGMIFKAVAIDISSTNYLRANTTGEFGLSSGQFKIIGSSGYIHGGPNGTNVNHVHPASEIKQTKNRVLSITKKNDSKSVKVLSSQINDFDSLFVNYSKEKITTEKFQFVSFVKSPYTEKMFSVDGSTNNYDLKYLDEVNDTLPFPGKDYKEYYKYKRAFSPFQDESKSSAGEISISSISEYSDMNL